LAITRCATKVDRGFVQLAYNDHQILVEGVSLCDEALAQVGADAPTGIDLTEIEAELRCIDGELSRVSSIINASYYMRDEIDNSQARLVECARKLALAVAAITD